LLNLFFIVGTYIRFMHLILNLKKLLSTHPAIHSPHIDLLKRHDRLQGSGNCETIYWIKIIWQPFVNDFHTPAGQRSQSHIQTYIQFSNSRLLIKTEASNFYQ